MRAYKFRGMDIQGRWFYGNLAIVPKNTANHKAGHYISNSAGMPFAYQVRPETVGQYTGLKDKNGKEIYEGDIVKGCFHDENRLTTVEWSNQWACWVVAYKEYGLSTFQHLEVIGNIHSNPELLEVKV